ncbi:hypothetical protein CGCA056_v004965 [Colletotrichum aenigma]|uniref:Uncharacterized protein n=1 Tax=Colletotrichum fructicola (strain Nara gc5) TaxID=1213859 RepID=A0A7J6JIV2_COLFN|nr:uncharacterized protein CGCA056_v004965 [Colletotrichum aenigma]KAF4489184.1 hypothetical protein CGGC5_v003786 [Colletotrichum fructicola Nara gc5]KAF4893227.1 hypothetical protein CGCFRS4_v007139 [Colletotrichum fructicola]KAF5522921.1 hypothetical protein CGCA056_v004965 [Colletotrichum aenigma]
MPSQYLSTLQRHGPKTGPVEARYACAVGLKAQGSSQQRMDLQGKWATRKRTFEVPLDVQNISPFPSNNSFYFNHDC